jgi:hypothetical protein
MSTEPGALSREQRAKSQARGVRVQQISDKQFRLQEVEIRILSKDNYLSSKQVPPLLSELEEQSRMLLAFRRRLKS